MSEVRDPVAATDYRLPIGKTRVVPAKELDKHGINEFKVSKTTADLSKNLKGPQNLLSTIKTFLGDDAESCTINQLE